MNYLIALAFITILASLFAALYFMIKGHEGKPQSMAKALAFRVGFSIFLFVCVLVAWKFGYLHPTGIRAGQ